MDRNDYYGDAEKLLFDIRQIGTELLTELKKLNQKEEPKEQNLDDLKRGDLIAKVKELPDKPQGWTKLSNEELKNLLK